MHIFDCWLDTAGPEITPGYKVNKVSFSPVHAAAAADRYDAAADATLSVRHHRQP